MTLRELPDRELIDQCLTGVDDAWVEFLRRFDPIILGVAFNTYRSRTPGHQYPDQSRLEDFRGDVHAKIFANEMHSLRVFDWTHENAFRAFLRVITVNVVADYIRKVFGDKRDITKEVSLDPAMPIADKQRDSSVDGRILLRQLATCAEKHLDAYPERTRDIAIFLLYQGHDVTAMDISKVYKLNVRTVENVIAKLRRVVRVNCLERIAVAAKADSDSSRIKPGV